MEDALWTVVEVDEDGNEIGDDLVSTGVLSQTGSNTDHLPSSRL